MAGRRGLTAADAATWTPIRRLSGRARPSRRSSAAIRRLAGGRPPAEGRAAASPSTSSRSSGSAACAAAVPTLAQPDPVVPARSHAGPARQAASRRTRSATARASVRPCVPHRRRDGGRRRPVPPAPRPGRPPGRPPTAPRWRPCAGSCRPPARTPATGAQLRQPLQRDLGDARHRRQVHDADLRLGQRVAGIGHHAAGEEAARQRLVVHQPQRRGGRCAARGRGTWRGAPCSG